MIVPRRGHALSAAELARVCGVDLKTIHHWAAKGKIPGQRTAGGHLRFWPLDVVDFLRAYELGIPDSLRHARLRVLVVDHDAHEVTAARRALSRRFEVAAFEHVVDALLALSSVAPDVLVVGDAAPLDAPAIAARLQAVPWARHVRVVARGDVGRLREALERLTAP